MSHAHRFYVGRDTGDRDVFRLSADEAHHAIHVVRVRLEDKVLLFDGAGREFTGVVESIGKKSIEVHASQVRDVPRPRVPIVLVQGWLNKSKNTEEVIQRGTELGVSAFWFFRGEHSERGPKSSPRWEQYAIQACKQCGNLWLPEFRVFDSLAQVLEAVDGRVLVATQHGEPTPVREAIRGAEKLFVVVGPEGDLGELELGRLEEIGATPVSLGPTTYRSEIAGELVCAVLQYELGALGPLPKLTP